MKRHEVGRQEELKLEGLELHCDTLSQTHLPKQLQKTGRETTKGKNYSNIHKMNVLFNILFDQFNLT